MREEGRNIKILSVYAMCVPETVRDGRGGFQEDRRVQKTAGVSNREDRDESGMRAEFQHSELTNDGRQPTHVDGARVGLHNRA